MNARWSFVKREHRKEPTGLVANARASTLLQTASVKALNPREKKRNCKVQVVLDLWSNDSYVTKDLKDRLRLEIVGSHKMTISGFGGASKGVKN